MILQKGQLAQYLNSKSTDSPDNCFLEPLRLLTCQRKKKNHISLEIFGHVTVIGYVYFQMLYGFHPLLLINGR